MIRLATVLLLLVITPPALAASADATLVWSCNYDVMRIVDDSVGKIRSRSRVRDGHAIPMEFQNHRVDIVVAEASETGVNVAVSLFEKSGEQWYEINPEPLTFSGDIGIPMRYQWTSSGIELDVAIIVSSQGR